MRPRSPFSPAKYIQAAAELERRKAELTAQIARETAKKASASKGSKGAITKRLKALQAELASLGDSSASQTGTPAFSGA
jgi:hypothetical protein